MPFRANRAQILPCEAPQCSTAGASPWHLWNDPHPQSSLLRLYLPVPAKPPHLPDAEIIEWINTRVLSWVIS